MPVPPEVLQWLDGEDGGLANHDLFLVLHRVWERLHAQGRDEAEITAILKTLSPLEFLAHGKRPHIWGSIFSPKREDDPAQGVEEYPKLADLGAADVESWAELSKELQRPQLRARFADAVWEFGKRLSSLPGLYRYGLLAVEAYFATAIETKSSAFYESLQAVTRGIQLAVQLRAKEQIARGFEFMMEFANTAEPEHIGRWLAPFDRLMHQRGIGPEQRERIVAALELRFWETVAGQDLHRQKMAGQALAKHHHARRDYDKAKQITLAYGEAIVKLTASQSPLIAVHHLSGVVDDYLRLGLRQDADRVRLLLEERGKGAGSEMREHVIEVKLELDDVELSIAEKLNHADPYFALWRLAWSCAPHPSETIERFRRASEGLVFHQLFPVSIIGNGGLPVASLGSYDNDQEGRHVMEYTREMHLNASFFMFGIEQWKKKFDRNDFSEVKGLFDCLLIPEDRRKVFQEGFAAYALGDYLKAIHVLIPQVENSLRKLLELVGVPLTKNDEEGDFELKNMNDVLHDETIRATLDERLWMFLKGLYTDKRGPNLRNMVMHGIAEPHEFSQVNAALVLQSVMLLTMVREKGIFFDQSEDLDRDKPDKSAQA